MRVRDRLAGALVAAVVAALAILGLQPTPVNAAPAPVPAATTTAASPSGSPSATPSGTPSTTTSADPDDDPPDDGTNPNPDNSGVLFAVAGALLVSLIAGAVVALRR